MRSCRRSCCAIVMNRILVIAAVFLSLTFISCHEELPPVNNPAELFTSQVSMQYVYDPAKQPSQSYVDIYLTYKNFYDETLEDFTSLKGTIAIRWIAPSEDRGAGTPVRIDELTLDNLFYAQNFDFTSNKLSIDPKDSIVLRYRWNMKTDDSTHLVTMGKYSLDRDCLVRVNSKSDMGFRKISSQYGIEIAATLTIFARGGTTRIEPVQFPLCWIGLNYGEPNPCAQPNPVNPCSIISP